MVCVLGREAKVDFLERILDIARENPEVIGNGKMIFRNSTSPAMDETCCVGLLLDKEGVPFFRVHGGYGVEFHGKTEEPEDVYIPDRLFDMAGRYFPINVEKFKEDFHLYRNERQLDGWDYDGGRGVGDEDYRRGRQVGKRKFRDGQSGKGDLLDALRG